MSERPGGASSRMYASQIGQSERVSDPADDSDFERWLQEISQNPGAPDDDPGEVSPGWRRWLRGLFEREGPVSQEVVQRQAMTHHLSLANQAVTAVQADLHRTTAMRPSVEVDIWMGNSIRISIDGGCSAPSIWEVDRPEAFAEVADYFQEQLDQECWPVCQQHDVGLHGEVHDGTAVWWCRLGRHSIARIGELGSAT